MIVIPRRLSSSGTCFDTNVAMLAVKLRKLDAVREMDLISKRGDGLAAPARDSVNQLWFDETFFDISLPGLVVSYAALGLFASEV